MNLHGLVKSAIGAINPMQTATVKRSAGYTTDDSGKQIPAYAPLQTIRCQVQSLTTTELAQLGGLNITGVRRKIYVDGQLDPVIRSRKDGGDIITMANGETYLIAQIIEAWPDWSCLAVVLQAGS